MLPNQFRSRDIILQRRTRRCEPYAASNFSASDRGQFAQLHQYVKTIIRDSASQARISQIISQDFNELSINAQAGKLPPAPCRFSFPGKSSSVLGNPAFSYLTPSMTASPQGKSAIHRGYFEQEMTAQGPAIRLYTTVAGKQLFENEHGKKEPDYKDIQLYDNGSVRIYPAGTILWVNAGEPLRALKWFEKYKLQNRRDKLPCQPLIRSFLIPTAVFLTLSQQAVSESDRKTCPTNPINVDKSGASNQFGITNDGIAQLQAHAIPKSLVTYAGNPQGLTHVDGIVRPIEALYQALGISPQILPQVFVSTSHGIEIAEDTKGALSDELMAIYAIWMGKSDEYITPEFLRTRICQGGRRTKGQWLIETLRKYGKIIPACYERLILTGDTPIALNYLPSAPTQHHRPTFMESLNRR